MCQCVSKEVDLDRERIVTDSFLRTTTTTTTPHRGDTVEDEDATALKNAAPTAGGMSHSWVASEATPTVTAPTFAVGVIGHVVLVYAAHIYPVGGFDGRWVSQGVPPPRHTW